MSEILALHGFYKEFRSRRLPFFIAVTRLNGRHWLRLTPLDIWFPNRLEVEEVFNLSEGRKTLPCKRPLGYHASLIAEELPAGAHRFLPVLSDGACPCKVINYDGACGLVFGTHDGNLHGDSATTYPGDDDADDLDFTDVPVNSLVNNCAIIRHEFDAIHEFCHSASVAVLGNGNLVFILELQNITAAARCYYTFEARTVPLDWSTL